MQKTSREQVAVADLIRDAIDVYLEALEDEEEPEDQTVGD
jgi:predicted RNase H-like HicB family nuclease|tara:strand:+ start:558 stop:677 length:120 start_codon:yes stop_codon:yes gene_type:complete